MLVYMYTMCMPDEGVRTRGTGITQTVVSHHMGAGNLTQLGPPEQPQALLTAELALQPLVFLFCFVFVVVIWFGFCFVVWFGFGFFETGFLCVTALAVLEPTL